jgi:hypothetical protein
MMGRRRSTETKNLPMGDGSRRNEPCPCGSGVKYKKCCMRAQDQIPQTIPAVRELNKKIQLQKAQELRYGKVRPVIHGDFHGHKMVAVGDELHWSTKWKTFPDFLFDYVKRVLGSDWGNSEIKKPYEQRHPIMQWYDDHCHFQAKQKKGRDGLYKAALSGPSAAYTFLAYDLYILRHHSSLQKEVIKRLKHKDQFQGSRYELFVAASIIRAGFTIAFEDERDMTRKHPEFFALHPIGSRIAVEAKSRHRPGVLGFRGKQEPVSNLKAGVKGLLDNALSKVKDEPLLVFIDLNLPPFPGEIYEKPWFDEVREVVEHLDTENPHKHPYNMIIFTKPQGSSPGSAGVAVEV